MGCWAGVIAAHSADLRCGQLRADSCASKTVLLAQLSFGCGHFTRDMPFTK